MSPSPFLSFSLFLVKISKILSIQCAHGTFPVSCALFLHIVYEKFSLPIIFMQFIL
ncbi:hypothetical protein CLOSTHATH_06080 [Hungatella hathewayi DSM 13479]|uniref:Uncharacterized protein n=1 Tax=Hungatella hathewayi DSM 13479 TaxID=566550 RepID=D3AR23_9FIRM|nr:hypothetical protein CLOSTHATH_06080 [Hungatella hathewayi DSM 13479]